MPLPKRIVICCDGTWQSSVSGLGNTPSNVTRITRHLARTATDSSGQEWQQIVFYDSGVGTGEIGLQSTVQGASGNGLATNVIEAYNFIVLNYEQGDKIYCFGFSRGAYTARAVAGLVTDIGVISPRNMQDFPEIYAMYQKNINGEGFRKSKFYHDWVYGVPAKVQPKDLGYKNMNFKWDSHPRGELAIGGSRYVEVVGVFDTVGSLGVPDIQGLDLSWFRSSFGFHNVKLSAYIKHAFHALAIDERRGPFTPTLWYLPHVNEDEAVGSSKSSYELQMDYSAATTPEQKLAAWQVMVDAETVEELKGAQSELVQVWFPGAHINIGGGSDDLQKGKKGDLEQMANITFAWMIEQLRPHLSFNETSIYQAMKEHELLLEKISQEKNYGEGWTGTANWFLEKANLKKIDTHKIADETKSGWGTGVIDDSFTGKMKIAGAIVRHPGQCVDEKTKIPLSKMGVTNEFIHPCVKYRYDSPVAKYKPAALEGYARRDRSDGQPGFEYFKKGASWAKKTPKKDKNGKVVGWEYEVADLKVPEYVIRHSSEFVNLERLAATGHPDSVAFIDSLDKVYGFEKE